MSYWVFVSWFWHSHWILQLECFPSLSKFTLNIFINFVNALRRFKSQLIFQSKMKIHFESWNYSMLAAWNVLYNSKWSWCVQRLTRFIFIHSFRSHSNAIEFNGFISLYNSRREREKKKITTQNRRVVVLQYVHKFPK